jgi:hypothetical protein
MQEHLPVELITNDELNHLRALLERESEGKVKKGLKKFIFKLANSKRIVTISDFNLLLSTRTRLGPLNLGQAKLVNLENASLKFLGSTRVMYYLQ